MIHYILEPWICHVLVVTLVSYILAKACGSPVLVILAACSIGLVFAWGLKAIDFVPGGWNSADAYWNDNSQIWRGFARILKGKSVKDPGAVWRGILFFWVAPVALSWVTVRLRSLRPAPAAWPPHPPTTEREENRPR